MKKKRKRQVLCVVQKQQVERKKKLARYVRTNVNSTQTCEQDEALVEPHTSVELHAHVNTT